MPAVDIKIATCPREHWPGYHALVKGVEEDSDVPPPPGVKKDVKAVDRNTFANITGIPYQLQKIVLDNVMDGTLTERYRAAFQSKRREDVDSELIVPGSTLLGYVNTESDYLRSSQCYLFWMNYFLHQFKVSAEDYSAYVGYDVLNIYDANLIPQIRAFTPDMATGGAAVCFTHHSCTKLPL